MSNVRIDLGCSGVLPVAFIALLIAKVIFHSSISWWVVFAPLMIAVILLILCVIGFIILKWKIWTK